MLLLVLRNKSYCHISFHKHHVGISPALHRAGSTLHGESGPSSVLPLGHVSNTEGLSCPPQKCGGRDTALHREL